MDKLLDRLCDTLDAELVRQETILTICRKKSDAIRALDMEALEARTAALETVLHETFEAESERHGVMREVVARFGLPEEGETLSGLIEVVPEPWKSRLQHFQRQLKETLDATQAVTRAYARECRQYLQLTGRQFARFGFDSDERKAGLYGPQGMRPGVRGVSSALVDQRG
jgi:hypothetical protein